MRRTFRRISMLLTALLAIQCVAAAELDLRTRVEAQEAIERVYHSHLDSSTVPFERAVPQRQVRHKVENYLRQSAALEKYWATPVTAEMLERELRRMRASSRMPERLEELFAALDHDPLLILECLARPALVDRLTRGFHASDPRFHDPGSPGSPGRDEKTPWDVWWTAAAPQLAVDSATIEPVPAHTLARISAELQAAADPGDASATGTFCLDDDTWSIDTLGAAPDGRYYHTVVWTGSLMLVWGGTDGGPDFGDGARYDPAIDSWSAISTVGAPAARARHSAVWTGSEMLIWGGAAPVNGNSWFYKNSGARYDPATDTWTTMSVAGAPSGRGFHSAVWTGSRMLIWGGLTGLPGQSPGVTASGGRYDPATDSWSSMSTVAAPTARNSHTVVWTGQEMLVWGGYGSSGVLGSGGRYDPQSDTWQPVSTVGAPPARSGHTAVWSGSLMLVYGGLNSGSGSLAGGRYDPANDTWTPMSGASQRRNHSAVWTGSRMAIWGGMTYDFFAQPISSGRLYDPTTDTWQIMSSAGAPEPRSAHTAVWTGDRMVVWGGATDVPYAKKSTGGRYDPATNSWTPTSTGPGPSHRKGHTAVWTGSHMLIWGGETAVPGEQAVLLGSGGRYDPATDVWGEITLSGAPEGRRRHTAVWTGDRMLIWGGNGAGLLADGGRYDPLANQWEPMTTVGAPSAREFHTAVWADGEMLVWGGLQGGSTYLGDGGAYDPNDDTWGAVSNIDAPTPRTGHTAIWTGEHMIVWGGRDSFDPMNDGGVYIPSIGTWFPVVALGAPSPRSGHSAVWTGSWMIVWGGDVSDSIGEEPTDSGGLYDPATGDWIPTELGAASPRYDHTAVWTGTEMIVWGGTVGVQATERLGDGARFKGLFGPWTPLSQAGAPRARTDHTAVWTGSAMLVWGGAGRSPMLNSGGAYAFGNAVDDDGDGLSECEGDCNDASIDSYPGAAELCDGLDNDCDGVIDYQGLPPPAEPVVLDIGGATLQWGALPTAAGYDVVLGLLQPLLASGGDFGAATEACIADDVPAAGIPDWYNPPVGDGLWFLVRPTNCTGAGSYDSQGPGQVTSRDAGIESAEASCP